MENTGKSSLEFPFFLQEKTLTIEKVQAEINNQEIKRVTR